MNGKPLTDKENQEHQTQEVEQQEQVKTRAEALALKLAQTYEELSRLLERNPGVKRQMTEGRQGLPEAEAAVEDGGHGSALPVGEAGWNELRVTADEAAHLLFCPYADGGSAGPDAEAATSGRPKRDPSGVNAYTEGSD
jgi:hypothetical protein